jgi:hypothetical protein
MAMREIDATGSKVEQDGRTSSAFYPPIQPWLHAELGTTWQEPAHGSEVQGTHNIGVGSAGQQVGLASGDAERRYIIAASTGNIGSAPELV